MSYNQLRLLGYLFAAAIAMLPLSSCVPLVAGAAVGYIAADEGYRVQSPIKKED